jgi:hypothetical protein
MSTVIVDEPVVMVVESGDETDDDDVRAGMPEPSTSDEEDVETEEDREMQKRIADYEGSKATSREKENDGWSQWKQLEVHRECTGVVAKSRTRHVTRDRELIVFLSGRSPLMIRVDGGGGGTVEKFVLAGGRSEAKEEKKRAGARGRLRR